MRKNIVAGNWKMNKSFQEAEFLINDILEELGKRKEAEAEIILCPPYPYLELALDAATETLIHIGAQNVSDKASGAYTGEIAAPMLASMGIDYCIIGHSERRKYFNESHKLLAAKTDILLDNDIMPIFCCGELLPEREKGIHKDVVKEQISEALFHLSPERFAKVVVAYEPVWAIGTGVTASPEQAQEMHAFIRQLLKEKYGEESAENTSILYGGSCKPSNASELFRNPDVDGGLIGGASLKGKDFIDIVYSF